MQTYIEKHMGIAKQYLDMEERPIGEKLSIIKSVNPKLHKILVHSEFAKVAIVLNDLTDERLALAIELILDRYVDLYVSDITLFVKMLAGGRYEKLYGAPTPSYICRCFQEYYEGRENVRANFREQQHLKRKRLHNETEIEIDYPKMIAKAKAEAKEEVKKNRKPVINTDNFKAEDFKKQEL